MADRYSMLSTADVDPVISKKTRTRTIDLAEELGCEKMRPKMWFLEPGNERKNYHTHAEQEEFYYVISGQGRMKVAGETLTVPEGTAVRVPPETPRKTFNDTGHEHIWLVVGAPAVEDPGNVHEE